MRARGAVTAVALLVALVGCSPGFAEPPQVASPTPTPTVQVTADPSDPAVVRATGAPLTSGPVTVTVVAPVAAATPTDDGSATVALSGGAALLAAPKGLTLEALSDGSAVVRDDAGRFVAGLTTEPRRTGLEQVGPEVIRLSADQPVVVWLASVAVESATWGEAEGGRSLGVVASAWARVRSLAAQDGLWTQVVDQAPDADVPGMQDQLECHELGAPDKASWNLEPWRPVVDGIDMIAARCNPT